MLLVLELVIFTGIFIISIFLTSSQIENSPFLRIFESFISYSLSIKKICYKENEIILVREKGRDLFTITYYIKLNFKAFMIFTLFSFDILDPVFLRIAIDTISYTLCHLKH